VNNASWINKNNKNQFPMLRLISSGILLSCLFAVSCHTGSQKRIEGSDKAEVTMKEIDSLISLMTLKEKLDLCHASSSFTSGGISRLGIPELVFSDGPHGVRHEHGRGWYALEDADDKATYLPVGICLASTWNKSLGYEYRVVLGNEAKELGKNFLLGPGINFIRSPLNGRNFEYLSEDTYLTAKMAVGYVKGLQDQGVAACAKHYAANNQETNRHKVDAIVSICTLHEIYFPTFRAVV
jgi:beta-glucosidase